MEKAFLNLCYEVLSHYLCFPDVADTYKSVNDGMGYLRDFPQNMTEFLNKRNEIINYIKQVRENNIIDAYRSNENPFLLIPVPSGKTLEQATPQELYANLEAEIPRLIYKGIHQTIKHSHEIDDNELTAELLKEDVNIFKKYNL